VYIPGSDNASGAVNIVFAVHAAFICLSPLFRLGERANSKEERHEKERPEE